MGGWGGFLVITVSHPTFCCVGVGLWLRWGWAVTIVCIYLGTWSKVSVERGSCKMGQAQSYRPRTLSRNSTARRLL